MTMMETAFRIDMCQTKCMNDLFFFCKARNIVIEIILRLFASYIDITLYNIWGNHGLNITLKPISSISNMIRLTKHCHQKFNTYNLYSYCVSGMDRR